MDKIISKAVDISKWLTTGKQFFAKNNKYNAIGNYHLISFLSEIW